MMQAEQHVHFIGIGGYGMSAIARVLLDLGLRVTGSDLAENKLTESLIQRGAEIHFGHDASLIEGADCVVYSTSIAADNVELVAARAKGIPVLHRSKMLARLLNSKKGIAVAGAHGKTTTSSMIAQTMEECGADPTYVIGGEVVGLGSNAKAGKSDYVVAEADESDGSFLEYTPEIAVITNIEADHLENYGGSFDNLKQAYHQFLSQIRETGVAVLCWDDSYVREIAGEFQGRVISYGIKQPADYMATNIHQEGQRIRFTVQYHEEVLGEVIIYLPGLHNVSNALAALVVCLETGLSFEEAAKALALFQGAKRRFHVVGEVNDILIVDDYAHHPTEIRATLNGVKSLNRRIVAVFQPQRYSRTHLLMEEFSHAFYDADEVIITRIYAPAGEKPIEGVTSQRLTELIQKNSNPRTTYCDTLADVEEYLLHHVGSGDLVLTMGAGDIWKVAHRLLHSLETKAKVEKSS